MKLRSFVAVALLAVFAGSARAAADDPAALYRDGPLAETVDRDFAAAIDLYERAAAAAQAFVNQQIALWARVVKARGITLE